MGVVRIVFAMSTILIIGAAVYSATEVVSATEKRVLTVLGEYNGVLEPGINFVPPFVSATYPIDRREQDLHLTEEIPSQDGDLVVDIVVSYKITDAETFFKYSGSVEEELSRRVADASRNVFSEINIEEMRSDMLDVASDVKEQANPTPNQWGSTVEDDLGAEIVDIEMRY